MTFKILNCLEEAVAPLLLLLLLVLVVAAAGATVRAVAAALLAVVAVTVATALLVAAALAITTGRAGHLYLLRRLFFEAVGQKLMNAARFNQPVR